MLTAIGKGREQFFKNFERDINRVETPRARHAANGAALPIQPNNAQVSKYMPLLKTTFGRAFDVADQIVRDADSATYGFELADNGIKATAMAEFNQGTPSAQRIAGLKGTDQPMLTGLPATKYWLLMAIQSGNKDAAQSIINDFLAPIEKEVAALGADGKPVQEYIDAFKKATAALTSSAFGTLVPTGPLGQEAILQGVGVTSGDAKVLLDAQQQMASSQQAMMDMFYPPQMRGMVKFNFTPNAKTIDGVQFNQIQQKVNLQQPGQPNNPQMAQMQQLMNWVYGPNGATGLLGALDAKTVIGAFGTSDTMISKTIASAKAGQDTLSQTPEIAAVAKELPKQRMVAVFFGLDQLVSTAANYAKMFGMPVNFQLPQNLPPIGATVATEGSAIRADGYVPTQLLQSIIAAGIQSYMQMQGGQAPGGPGGL